MDLSPSREEPIAIGPSRPADRRLMVELLTQHDIVPTQQRVEIARWLFSRPQHLCAEQLIGLLAEAHSTVSKATVYNTLGLFAGKGLVREVIVDPSRVFYDTTIRDHYHFYDLDSGTLTDIPEDELMIVDLPSPPPGCEIAGIDVVVRVRRLRQ